MLLKPFDFGLAIPLFGLVIASFFVVYTGIGDHGVVKLKGESGEWVFPMDTVETTGISGPLGDTVITINEGAARVTSSPCMNQTCVAAGAIRLPGQWLACLPNRVMVYIDKGTSSDDVDATTW